MSPSYSLLVQTLSPLGFVPAADIYITDTVPRLTSVYDFFYDFGNTHLQSRKTALGFPTSYLFFRNDYSVNAFARTRETYKMIGINYGCIEIMYDAFEEKAQTLVGPLYESLHTVAQKIGNPLHVDLFQFFSLFVYYHEYAHLVQRSPVANFDIDELTSLLTPDQIIQSHAYELDADWYSVSSVALHIAQFFKNQEGEFDGTEQEVADLASIGLAAILAYFVKSGGPLPVLYLQAKKHPHPFVRLSYCSVFLLDTLGPNLPVGFALDKKAIMNKAVLIASAILTENGMNPLEGFAEIFMENSAAIHEHINSVISFAVEDPNLCPNRPMNQV